MSSVGNFKIPINHASLYNRVIQAGLRLQITQIRTQRRKPSPLVSGSWSITKRSIIKLLCAHATSLENALQCAAESEPAGRLEIIEFLLDQGAEIDAIKWEHHQFSYECFERLYLGTPLNHAVLCGFKDRVELFLRRGARVDIKNSMGQTPLETARDFGHDDICDLLERHQARET